MHLNATQMCVAGYSLSRGGSRHRALSAPGSSRSVTHRFERRFPAGLPACNSFTKAASLPRRNKDIYTPLPVAKYEFTSSTGHGDATVAS